MDIFSLFTLFGGLAFFLYGMHVMSSGLEKMAGGKLEVLLKRMTSNPFKSLALGAGITIAIQSSSALTVMPGGEHWFHTDEQLRFLDRWISA